MDFKDWALSDQHRQPTRRTFIGGLGALGATGLIGACGPSENTPPVDARLRVPQRQSPQWQPISDTLQKRLKAALRPLAQGATSLPRDEELLRGVKAWFGNILLGSRRYSLTLEPNFAFQLANIRPDCNGYVFRITDVRLLAKVIADGGKKVPRAEALLAKVTPEQIRWGSLYWLRQIKPGSVDKESSDGPQKPGGDFVEEVYWLDVFYETDQLVLPLIRIYYNSVGVVSFEGLRDGWLDSLIPETPYFVEAHTLVLNWHELADRLQLQNNYYYLRACFTAANFDKDVTGKSSAHGLKRLVVFRPEGASAPSDIVHTQLVWPRSFDEAKPYAMQVSALATATVGDLKDTDLSQPPPRIGQQQLPRDWAYRRQDPISPPKPEVFLEASRAGRDFIFFITNQFGGVRYEGQGYFSVIFQMTGPAAERGIRGSGWKENVDQVGTIIVTVGGGTVGGVVIMAGGLVAAGAVVGGDWIVSSRRSDPERQQLRKTIIENAEACAAISKTEAECEQCSKGISGSYDEERGNLGADIALELAADLALGPAVACGGALLVSLIPGVNIAAGATCAVIATAALVGGLAAGLADWAAYQAELNNLENDATGPCKRMGMTF